MLKSKERSYLRGIASKENAIFQIGKNEIDEDFLNQIDLALKKRELIKISILKNSSYDIRDAADFICDNVKCECVQIIGNKVVLYKENSDNKRIIFG